MGNVLHQNLQISKTNVQEIVQIIPQILNIIWIASAALQIYIFDAGLIYIHVKTFHPITLFGDVQTPFIGYVDIHP